MWCRILKTKTSRGGDFSGTFSCAAAKSIQLLHYVSRLQWAEESESPFFPIIESSRGRKGIRTALSHLLSVGWLWQNALWLQMAPVSYLAAWTISMHFEVAVNLQHLQKHWAGFTRSLNPETFPIIQAPAKQKCFQQRSFTVPLLYFTQVVDEVQMLWYWSLEQNLLLVLNSAHRQSPWEVFLGTRSSLLGSHPWECISYD